MADNRSAKYWHDRAEEARAMASEMTVEATQLSLLKIAAEYDSLAERAEAQEKKRTDA